MGPGVVGAPACGAVKEAWGQSLLLHLQKIPLIAAAPLLFISRF